MYTSDMPQDLKNDIRDVVRDNEADEASMPETLEQYLELENWKIARTAAQSYSFTVNNPAALQCCKFDVSLLAAGGDFGIQQNIRIQTAS